jgi:chaperonin GroES
MTNVFQPLSDKLICKPVEQDDVSAGGIILPELDDQKTLKAKVLVAGPGFWAAPDLFVQTTCETGDIIVYQRFAAQVMEYDGVDYHIIQERDVLTKITTKTNNNE